MDRTGKKVTRRSVAMSGLAFAGGCFAGLDMRAVLAQAAMQGKPLFTAQALTAMMRGPDRAKLYSDLASEPGTNLVAFLSRRFTLTKGQIAAINSIPRQEVAQLKQAVKTAFEQSTGTLADKASDQGKFSKSDETDPKPEPPKPKPPPKPKSAARRINVKAQFVAGALTIEINEVAVTAPSGAGPAPPAAKTSAPPSGGLLGGDSGMPRPGTPAPTGAPAGGGAPPPPAKIF